MDKKKDKKRRSGKKKRKEDIEVKSSSSTKSQGELSGSEESSQTYGTPKKHLQPVSPKPYSTPRDSKIEKPVELTPDPISKKQRPTPFTTNSNPALFSSISDSRKSQEESHNEEISKVKKHYSSSFEFFFLIFLLFSVFTALFFWRKSKNDKLKQFNKKNRSN